MYDFESVITIMNQYWEGFQNESISLRIYLSMIEMDVVDLCVTTMKRLPKLNIFVNSVVLPTHEHTGDIMFILNSGRFWTTLDITFYNDYENWFVEQGHDWFENFLQAVKETSSVKLNITIPRDARGWTSDRLKNSSIPPAKPNRSNGLKFVCTTALKMSLLM